MTTITTRALHDAWRLRRRRWAGSTAVKTLLKMLGRAGVTVARDDIVWCYRNLLGREPESEAAVIAHSRFFRFKTLVRCFVQSPEYAGGASVHDAATQAVPAAAGIPEVEFRRLVDTYLAERKAGEPLRDYAGTHIHRLHDTLNVIHRVLPNGGHMIDYSAAGFFSDAVRRFMPAVEQASVTGVNFELDDYIGRYGRARYDLCVNTEVLEHLAFNPSHMIFAINAMLKTGGFLFLSTPNAISMANGLKILSGNAPALWNQFRPGLPYFERHNREWTPFEVATLLEEHGFEVMEVRTCDFYTTTGALVSRNQERCRWLKHNSTHTFHGDTLTVLARKLRDIEGPVQRDWLYASTTHG